MATKRNRLEREIDEALERNVDGMAQLLQTELIAHGINLVHGRPERKGNESRGTTRVELWFDGKDTANLEKLIAILRRARGLA